MKKQQFIQNNFPHAQKAGEVFNLNPVVILAQSALETGWGQSVLSTEHHNYFGICGYGRPNDYWSGRTVQLEVDGLMFRGYGSPEESFLDYARLIRSAYRRAADMSYFPDSFAKEIAYSPYISEVNGDNREAYRKTLVKLCEEIGGLIDN